MSKVTVGVCAALALAAGLMLPVASVATVTPTPTTQVLYRDVGSDPPNRLPHNPLARWADVLKSTRVMVHQNRNRVLKVTLTARRDFPMPRRIWRKGSIWLYVSLDTRRGPKADYAINFRNYRRRNICELVEPPAAPVDGCRATANGNGALRMRSPIRHAHITKHVRWRITTTLDAGPVFDLAPNHGWYS